MIRIIKKSRLLDLLKKEEELRLIRQTKPTTYEEMVEMQGYYAQKYKEITAMIKNVESVYVNLKKNNGRNIGEYKKKIKKLKP